MKIVHVSHLYHPSSGGVQFFFKNISERLVKDYGDEVTVVTTDSYYGPERKVFKKIKPAEEIINGVKVVRFPYRRWHIKPFLFMYKVLGKLRIKKPEWMVLRSYGPYSQEMKKFLTTVKCDAFCGSSSNYLFMQMPLWRKCNFFYYGSIHLDEDESKSALYPTQVRSINASNLYLANTGFEKARLIKSGVTSEKIFVLGTGVDMAPFTSVSCKEINEYKQTLQLPTEALVIGYIGRIELTKSVLLVIKAFEKLAKQFKNIYLVIAGSGSDYVHELKAYCSMLSPEISERIKWQVNFPMQAKSLLFNSIDILVLPSQNESFGLVFLEAWSCKKPVIGASIGAVRDVIHDGVDGLLMEVGDENSLAKKLATLITNEPLRKAMGESGFKKVQENYTWDIIVSQLRQLYVNAGNEKYN